MPFLSRGSLQTVLLVPSEICWIEVCHQICNAMFPMPNSPSNQRNFQRLRLSAEMATNGHQYVSMPGILQLEASIFLFICFPNCRFARVGDGVSSCFVSGFHFLFVSTVSSFGCFSECPPSDSSVFTLKFGPDEYLRCRRI